MILDFYSMLWNLYTVIVDICCCYCGCNEPAWDLWASRLRTRCRSCCSCAGPCSRAHPLSPSPRQFPSWTWVDSDHVVPDYRTGLADVHRGTVPEKGPADVNWGTVPEDGSRRYNTGTWGWSCWGTIPEDGLADANWGTVPEDGLTEVQYWRMA